VCVCVAFNSPSKRVSDSLECNFSFFAPINAKIAAFFLNKKNFIRDSVLEIPSRYVKTLNKTAFGNQNVCKMCVSVSIKAPSSTEMLVQSFARKNENY